MKLHEISLIAAAGNTISVKACGKGSAIIFLHGFPLDHRMWLSQLIELSDRFYCLAIEVRGFGGSSLDGEYLLQDLADDVEQVRRLLSPDQPVHLVGLSMGGYVAFEYWRKYRQNLATLTLANTKPGADSEDAKQQRLQMAERVKREGVWPALQSMVSRLMAPEAVESSVGLRVAEMLQSASPSAVATAQTAMASRQDFCQQLPLIRTPCLVMAGGHDVITPADATEQWAANLPNHKLRIIPSAGHLSPMESPEQFTADLVEFLIGHTP
jgi:3-oxoadipate enol-lactonase